MQIPLDGGFFLDDDRDRVDREAVHAFLTKSYWAAGRDRGMMNELIASATRVVGLYDGDGRQTGFARAISDRHVMSYLADVYVREEARGRGFGLELVRFMIEGEELASTSWLLRTHDMHGLYAKLGFVGSDERTMQRRPGGVAENR